RAGSLELSGIALLKLVEQGPLQGQRHVLQPPVEGQREISRHQSDRVVGRPISRDGIALGSPFVNERRRRHPYLAQTGQREEIRFVYLASQKYIVVEVEEVLGQTGNPV